MPITEDLIRLIYEKAAAISTFNDRLGPGGGEKGNAATNRFVKQVNAAVRERWENEVKINHPAIPKARFNFDFYVPSEATAVEIALSIRNPVSEYEKDIFKALLARDAGMPMKRLVLIGKDGSVVTRGRPGPLAIRTWAKRTFDLQVDVLEIGPVASETLEDDAPSEP